jgi:uncharacterized membrane protein
MPSLLTFVRWVHFLAGAGWFGEVVIVAFVLVPFAGSLPAERQREYLLGVFPRVFQVASWLAGTSLAAGLLLNYLMTGWTHMGAYFDSMRGGAILVGALLGGLLASVHYFIEPYLEQRLLALNDAASQQRLMQILTVVPRAGLLVMVGILVSMMIGARGV